MSEKENNREPGEAPELTQHAEDKPEEKPVGGPAESPEANRPDSSRPAQSSGPSSVGMSQRAAVPASKQSKGGGALVAWLALLLVLALGAGAAWVVQQGMAREAALQARVAELEATEPVQQERQPPDFSAIENRFQDELQQSEQSLRQLLAQRAGAVEVLAQRLDTQEELLEKFSASDQGSWLRAEAQYLLRLANQRVLMARDPESAIALLQSADDILRELDDPGLHAVRAAVAAEIAALRAMPEVDIEGIYLRLSALVEQAGRLRIFEAPEIQPAAPGEVADNWQTRLRRGYEQAVAKLSEYIVIRRRDVPMQALMDPQWEGLVRQNLRMLLEQAQVALLGGNQTLYRESLERARHWVAQFADTDEAAATAMDSEIVDLQNETVAIELPDLSRSVQALDATIRQRPRPVEEE